jgi:hypothetical protein
MDVTPLRDPRESTVRRLFALSGNRCAFPDCSAQLVTGTTIVGEVCHIGARSVGGPRYLASQTDEERHGFDNLVLMCRNHHKVIDAEAGSYTVDWLVRVKQEHEAAVAAAGIEDVEVSDQVIAALTFADAIYNFGATHVDVRGSTFNVGGQGGGPLGGGGQGGMLVIGGIADLPRGVKDQITLNLEGGDGQWPGAGGGGGGSVAFVGRPANDQDITDGLAVPVFFPVNSWSLSADNLLDMLGAGWEHFSADEFPWHGTINVVFAVEFGRIDPNTLLGFEIAVCDENGVDRGVGSADVAVPEPLGRINRSCRGAPVPFTPQGPGIHELIIRSGGVALARYRFDVRPR